MIISHRGNIDGRKIQWENHPSYVKEAAQEFNVEIDVWKFDESLYLGHDKPQYEINVDFLFNYKFWCHAKNIDALNFMLRNSIHCFWHQTDNFTITSKGYIWCYPNNYPKMYNTIWLDFDNSLETYHYGICTDNPIKYKEKICHILNK